LVKGAGLWVCLPLLGKDAWHLAVILLREDVASAVWSLADVPHPDADGELLFGCEVLAIALEAADLTALDGAAEEAALPAQVALHL
jgi:hypothetical protein